jgi:hypothetical protein
MNKEEPLSEESRLVLAAISSHSGIAGEYILKLIGFDRSRCIDAIKPLVLRKLVYLKFDDPVQWFHPRFEICRFFMKI